MPANNLRKCTNRKAQKACFQDMYYFCTARDRSQEHALYSSQEGDREIA